MAVITLICHDAISTLAYARTSLDSDLAPFYTLIEARPYYHESGLSILTYSFSRFSLKI